MRIRIRTTRALATSLLVLCLPGCSDQGQSTPGTPTTGSVSSTGSSDPVSGEPSTQPTPTMPLNPYRAIAHGWVGQNAEQTAAEINKRLELTGQCMRDQGFEYFYTPTTAEQVRADEAMYQAQLAVPEHPEGFGTLAFAETYGFGIGRHVPEPEEQEEEPEDETEPEVDSAFQKQTDYHRSLSQSERMAWYTAYQGDVEGTDFPAPGEPEDPDAWKKRGCLGWAEHEARTPTVAEDPAFAELLSAIAEATPSPDNDEDMATLEREWSACMNAEGYDFARREDAYLTVQEEHEYMYRKEKGTGEDGKGGKQHSPTEEERERFFTERHLPTAIADATCAENAGYDKRLHDLTVAFEQRFIKEHQAQLDDLVLQYGTEQAG